MTRGPRLQAGPSVVRAAPARAGAHRQRERVVRHLATKASGGPPPGDSPSTGRGDEGRPLGSRRGGWHDGRVPRRSVLALVDDRAKAMREMVRVIRPGGRIGLDGSIWTRALPPDLAALKRDLGADVQPVEVWRGPCAEAGLEGLIVRLRRIDPAREVRDRLRWVGLPWAIRAWAGTLWLQLTVPASRAVIRTFTGPGRQVFDCVGYGSFVGSRPSSPVPRGVVRTPVPATR
jgi:hypothetical protein